MLHAVWCITRSKINFPQLQLQPNGSSCLNQSTLRLKLFKLDGFFNYFRISPFFRNSSEESRPSQIKRNEHLQVVTFWRFTRSFNTFLVFRFSIIKKIYNLIFQLFEFETCVIIFLPSRFIKYFKNQNDFITAQEFTPRLFARKTKVHIS